MKMAVKFQTEEHQIFPAVGKCASPGGISHIPQITQTFIISEVKSNC
jgi:hypothetical protein